MNISSFISRNANFHSHYKAIICSDDGREFTWSDLDKIVNKFGNALLNDGVKRGDTVAIYLPNSPEYLFAFFALQRIGAIAVPFNILLTTREASYILNNTRAKLMIGASKEVQEHIISAREQFKYLERIITVGEELEGTTNLYSFISEASEVLETVDSRPDDAALLVYTSGTTGQPKGAIITCNNLMANGTLSSTVLHINDEDLLLTGAPFCHIFFVLTVLGTFNSGAGILTMRQFHPEKTLQLISKYQVTHFAGVPAMFIFMVKSFDKNKHDLSSLRFVQSAGAAMPVEHVKEIEEKFGVKLAELYGATETSSTVTYNRMGHNKNGSVGKAAYGVQVKLVDTLGNEVKNGEIGEILVKSPGIFKGYWEMPEATEAAFEGDWFRTGDLANCDSDGNYYIVDRIKDMIISGGYNVYPREIEEVIYQHPKVMEAAVLGVKEPNLGEVPKAFVSLKEGQIMADQELIDFMHDKLASYKVPRSIEFVPNLPKSPTGKILKNELRVK